MLILSAVCSSLYLLPFLPCKPLSSLLLMETPWWNSNLLLEIPPPNRVFPSLISPKLINHSSAENNRTWKIAELCLINFFLNDVNFPVISFSLEWCKAFLVKLFWTIKFLQSMILIFLPAVHVLIKTSRHHLSNGCQCLRQSFFKNFFY